MKAKSHLIIKDPDKKIISRRAINPPWPCTEEWMALEKEVHVEDFLYNIYEDMPDITQTDLGRAGYTITLE